jgi:hypothetical protein
LDTFLANTPKDNVVYWDFDFADGSTEPNLWGDYFHLEALTRLKQPDWIPYW